MSQQEDNQTTKEESEQPTMYFAEDGTMRYSDNDEQAIVLRASEYEHLMGVLQGTVPVRDGSTEALSAQAGAALDASSSDERFLNLMPPAMRWMQLCLHLIVNRLHNGKVEIPMNDVEVEQWENGLCPIRCAWIDLEKKVLFTTTVAQRTV